nr:hypothetical protein [Tanacetum cinerariifolium]
MDIRDEVKASKGDELPKSSLLLDSDQNNPLNKPQFSFGVKGIDRVSPIKLNGTGNSDSPRNRHITMSERDMLVSNNPQPVSQFTPITGELIMSNANVNFIGITPIVLYKLTDLEKDKVNVGKDKAPKHKLIDLEKDKVNFGKDKAPVKNLAAVVYKARKQKTSVKKPAAVVEKPDAVVDKAPKHKALAKKPASVVVQDKDNVTAPAKEPASVVVQDKAAEVAPVIEKVPVATKSDKETHPVVVTDVKAPVVVAVEKDNPKVTSKVSDESVKAPVVKENVKVSSVAADKPSSVVSDKVDVVKDNINVVADKVVNENMLSVVADKASNINVVAVADKASDALKNKPAGKGKKPVVEIPVLRLSKQKENPEFKDKVNVKRKMILSKKDDRKKKLKGKSKKDVSDSKLETDVVDYSFNEADRKRKKLKIKVGLKRNRSCSDSSDSSELDTKSIKRLISKLEKKVEKEEFDEESVPKKGKKKLTKKIKKEESDEESVSKKGKKKEKQLMPEEAAHEEYLSSFPSFHARTTPSSLFCHQKLKSDKIKVTPSKIHDMLGVPFGGYSLFDLDERKTDHEFVDGLKGQICLDVVRRLREDSVIFDIDWYEYIYDCLRDSKLPGGTNHYLGPLTFLIELKLKDRRVGLLDLHNECNKAEVQESKDLIKKAEEKLSLICAERVMLEDYMRKASLKCPSDGKFVALHEKYVNLFKDPISFKDDGNEDNVGDDDDENEDDNDANDGDGNGDEEDVNEGNKDLNRSNSSFGFSKISLEDFGNDRGPAEKDKVVEGNPTKQ